MEQQLCFWDISWTDAEFEVGMTRALSQVEKLRRGIFARYTADQKRLEDLEGIIQELVSYRVDRSQAMGGP